MLRITKRLMNRTRNVVRNTMGRKRFERSIRPSDIFIVTFPKSGTNWVGYFLALVVADRATGQRAEPDLDEANQWVRGANSEYLGGEPLPGDEDGRSRDPRVYKIHAPHDPKLRRAIYLVRDPRDVMVSYYYHRQRKTQQQLGLSIDEYVEANDTWPCDWGEHVSGWLDHADSPDVLLLRYEDLKTDTKESFRRIADFCDLRLTDEELADYIERSSFSNMRQAEAAAGSPEAGDLRFTRKGVVGDWRNELSPESVALIEQRYGTLMRRLDYGPAVGSAVR
jgi:hypothetical protein